MKDHVEVSATSCEQVFDQFVTAVTCKTILSNFHKLLDITGLRHDDHINLFLKLKSELSRSWKTQSLWTKLEKKAAHKDYKKGQACSNLRVLIIGSGPCGLRTAIECAFLGAKTVIVEKRGKFSRNNVLHLWPYLITDLRNLGAKKFYGKFCAGTIDHISIRQLQCILLKVALLLGVEVHMNVTFEGLVDPPDDQSSGVGWRAKVTPVEHILSEYEFDVLIGADGKRNTLSGFKRKEFRGKLALAITANFINRNTQAEARVEEISGVAFIFNQKFFMNLKESTGIDLENIVYYKDDTHYFVMTAKKTSLLEKGVLKKDFSDTLALLDRSNVNQDALMAYAREAADFSTNHQLPFLDYAVNHYGQADVAMFDFTSMFAAENASKFILKNFHHLLVGLVGDSLVEPFWPTGSGCARGFLSAFDAAWMIRSWAMGKTPLQVLAERESIYTILSQTTSSYLNKNYNMYSIDPNTRYPNLNMTSIKPSQVRHLYEGDVSDTRDLEVKRVLQIPSEKLKNDSYKLLHWCQTVLNNGKYSGVHVVDFTSSWYSGLALCALIHSFRPQIIDYFQILESDIATTNQLAFNVAENELGIAPVMTGEDMAKCVIPDKLTMISYLAQFYEIFRHEIPISSMALDVNTKNKASTDFMKVQSVRSSNKRVSLLQKLNNRLARSKKRKEQEGNEGHLLRLKKLKETEKDENELVHSSKLPLEMIASRMHLDNRKENNMNKPRELSGAVSVIAMADILVAKFRSHEDTELSDPARTMKSQPSLFVTSVASETCYFCQKKVYIMERLSAEGVFFHRGCLKCDHCGMGLRLTNYACDRELKPVKFYCYRHAVPEMRTYPQRKQILEDEAKKEVPGIIITSPSRVDSGQHVKDKLQVKKMSTHLSRTLSATEGAKNTPERVEFEISFDGEEEPEENQFEHNLKASLSSDMQLNKTYDSESSDSDVESFSSGFKGDVWADVKPLDIPATCELRCTWREQQCSEKNTNGDMTPLKADAVNMLLTTYPNEVEENLRSNVLTDVMDKKSVQSRNKTDSVENKLKDRFQNSILKKPLKGLEVSDVDEVRSYACNECALKSEKNKPMDKKKLLHNTCNTSFPRNSTSENLLLEPCGPGENTVFIEGHLSPSASKTRRFHLKHRTKNRELANSKISKNEALPNRYISEVYKVNNELLSVNLENNPKFWLRDGIGKNTKYKNVRTTQSINTESSINDESIVAGMFQTSDSDLVLHVDNKYVTDRHQDLVKNINSATRRQVKDYCLKDDTEFAPLDTSFSISTPSDSESSVSSIELGDVDISSPGVKCSNGYNSSEQGLKQKYTKNPDFVLKHYCMENTIVGVTALKSGFVDNNIVTSEAELKDDYNNNKYMYGHNGADEKPQILSSDSLYITPGGNLKQPVKAASNFIFLTRPLPPPGSQNPCSPRHRFVPSANVSTSKTEIRTSLDDNKLSSNPNQTNVTASKQLVTSAIKQTPSLEVLNSNSHQIGFSLNQLKSPHLETKKEIFTEDDAINQIFVKGISSLDESENKQIFYTSCASDTKDRSCFEGEIGSDGTFCTHNKNKLTHSSEISNTRQIKSHSSSIFKEINTSVLSIQQIREICMADMERARIQARNRAKLKTDEELGITVIKPVNTKKVPILNRYQSLKVESKIMYDLDHATNDNRGTISNSSDNRTPSIVTTEFDQNFSSIGNISKESVLTIMDPSLTIVESSYINSAQVTDSQLLMKTDNQVQNNFYTNNTSCRSFDNSNNKMSSHLMTTGNQLSEPITCKGKKFKWKTRKTKKETIDRKSEVKDKKMKYLLALIRWTKIPKKETKGSNVTLSPDSLSNEKDQSLKTTSKAKKSKGKKTKLSTGKSDFYGSPDTAQNSNYCRNLALCSFFHSDFSNRQVKNLLGFDAAKKSIIPALRTDVEEISDSDESYISLSSMQKRKNGDFETRVTRRLCRIQQKQQIQIERKRLRMAQELQRQLEEVEVRQRDLEDRGIVVEKALRGNISESEEDNQLMSEWFTLVHEKNALLRYESELMVRAKELELEDRQARLENDFRERTKQPEITKTVSDLAAEDKLLEELLDVVEQRNSLVAMLEEDRLREQKEDNELKEMMAKKGYILSPLSFDTCSGKEGRQAEISMVSYI